MYKLIIDGECDGCGSCELIIPTMAKKMLLGKIFISDGNLIKYRNKIDQAINSCHSGILKLEEIEC